MGFMVSKIFGNSYSNKGPYVERHTNKKEPARAQHLEQCRQKEDESLSARGRLKWLKMPTRLGPCGLLVSAFGLDWSPEPGRGY